MSEERTRNVWVETAPATGFPRLQGDLQVDVAVVGAGFTGLTAALLLTRAGKRVAVLERARVAMGESGFTTAHMTGVLDTGLPTLASDFGEDRASVAVRSNLAAIDQVERWAQELRIDCQFERMSAYVYTESERDVRSLREQANLARRLGLMATVDDAVPLPFPVKAGYRVDHQARIHPRRYLVGLAEALAREGAQVFEETQVRKVDGGTPCRVETDHGTVTATDVIEATNVPIGKTLTVQAKLVPYRTYVVGGWAERDLPGLCWDTADPYHYIRTQVIDGRPFLMVGGEDHRVGAETDTERHYGDLQAYAEERFPGVTFDHRWSGEIIEPVDGLPYVGKYPGTPHVWVATGYSGNGTTNGTMAGMLLADLLTGRGNAWAELYDPGRMKALAGARDFVAQNVEYMGRLVGDRLHPAEAGDLGALGLGEGKIVSVQGEKVAVYRDDDGAYHAVSPVCSHAYCHVHFNNAERTWDCPCHGSRFGPDGEVQNGPATKPLERKELPPELTREAAAGRAPR